jgi:hypothetical protein
LSDPSLTEIMQALATQIDTTLAGTAQVIPGLQVTPLLNWNPSPPSIDMFPATPFQEPIAFGPGNNELNFTVRARVNTPDHEGAQELLLMMMDRNASESVALAILGDTSLGGKVEHVNVEGPSDYGVFIEPSGAGAFLSCTWLAKVTP